MNLKLKLRGSVSMPTSVAGIYPNSPWCWAEWTFRAFGVIALPRGRRAAITMPVHPPRLQLQAPDVPQIEDSIGPLELRTHDVCTLSDSRPLLSLNDIAKHNFAS